MAKISDLKSPAIAGVVRKRNVKEAIAEILNLYYDGADMIDLHMSCLENPCEQFLKEIISSSPMPVLTLNYNMTYEGDDAGSNFAQPHLREMRLAVDSISKIL